MGVSIDMTGVVELIDEVNLMAAAPGRVVNSALKAAAQPIYEESQRNLEKETPHHVGKTTFEKSSVDTGKLKDSGTITSVKSDKYSGKYVKVQYDSPGMLVEEGHGGPAPAPAHPFLRPAFEAKKAEAAEILAAKLKEAMR